ELSLAVAERAVSTEQVDRRVVHTDADAARLHRLDELTTRERQPLERQQRRKDMPAVARITALRQSQRRILAPQLEIARHQRAPPGVEFLQAPELPETDRGGDVRQVALAAGEQRVEVVRAAPHLPVPAMQLDRRQLVRRAARDRAALDGGDVLVGMETEAHQVAEAADALARPRRTDRMRRVLDDAQPVARRE